MTRQKILFYIASSVTSIGTTKEGEHPYQEIKPPEVQARARDPWMAFDVGQKDLRTSFPRFSRKSSSSTIYPFLMAFL